MDSEFAVTVGGASGLIVHDGKVLLIKRAKEPYKNHWSLPGGGVKRGETLREAARREVLEETGLEVEIGVVAGFREERVGEDDHCIVVAFQTRVIGGALCAGSDALECDFVEPSEILDRQTTPGLEDVLRDAGLL